ncbi:MAG: MerR family transcriptional regulator [Chitinophagaceae bacterium]|nr:MerR family transcriptional regulator [Chitinophagaceae bacterium]
MELTKVIEDLDPAYVEKLERFKKKILDQKYPASVIAPFVNSRVLNYWVEEAELLKKWNEKGWRKFSFLEIIWLKVISDLREFGVSFEILKKLKDELFRVPTTEEILIAFEEKRKGIQDLLKKGTLSGDVKYMHEMALKLKDFAGDLEDSEIMPMFANLIFIIVLYRLGADLVINKHGKFAIFLETSKEVIVVNPEVQQLLNEPHISIPLTNIIESFILKDEIDKELQTEIFTEEEWKILEILRREKPNSLTVTFDDKQKINLVEITKSKKVDIANRLSNIILKGGYETITLKTQKGKVVSCTQTEKLKL